MQQGIRISSVGTAKQQRNIAPMPIKKETAASIRRFGYHYESIPREVVQRITNPVALAYYTYLLTMPEGWTVRRAELMNHFCIGRRKHDSAMRMLRDLGVVWHQDERNEQGHIVERLLMVGAVPVDDLPIDNPKSHSATLSDSPEVTLSTTWISPPDGKRDHLENSISIRESHNKTLENTTAEVESLFALFYEAYPKKVGRAEALKAWKKLKPSAELTDQLIADIQKRVNQGAWCTGQGKQYIPGPAPYLNQRKWEDEIIPRPEFKAPVDYAAIGRSAVEL